MTTISRTVSQRVFSWVRRCQRIFFSSFVDLLLFSAGFSLQQEFHQSSFYLMCHKTANLANPGQACFLTFLEKHYSQPWKDLGCFRNYRIWIPHIWISLRLEHNIVNVHLLCKITYTRRFPGITKYRSNQYVEAIANGRVSWCFTSLRGLWKGFRVVSWSQSVCQQLISFAW